MAVASDGPYANLHLHPDTCQYATTQFFHRPDALPAAQPTSSKPSCHQCKCKSTEDPTTTTTISPLLIQLLLAVLLLLLLLRSCWVGLFSRHCWSRFCWWGRVKVCSWWVVRNTLSLFVIFNILLQLESAELEHEQHRIEQEKLTAEAEAKERCLREEMEEKVRLIGVDFALFELLIG